MKLTLLFLGVVVGVVGGEVGSPVGGEREELTGPGKKIEKLTLLTTQPGVRVVSRRKLSLGVGNRTVLREKVAAPEPTQIPTTTPSPPIEKIQETTDSLIPSSSEIVTTLPIEKNEIEENLNLSRFLTPELMLAILLQQRQGEVEKVAVTPTPPPIATKSPREETRSTESSQPAWMTLITTPVNLIMSLVRALMRFGEVLGGVVRGVVGGGSG